MSARMRLGMIDTHALRVPSLALTFFTLVLVALPSDARGGEFKADSLRDCVGSTREDLEAAPAGTELPFGGVRIFEKDHQRGRSVVFCVTMPWRSAMCCHSDNDEAPLPKWLRKDAESLRAIIAPGCSLTVGMLNVRPRISFQRYRESKFDSRPTRYRLEIPEAKDDALWWGNFNIGCWDHEGGGGPPPLP